MILLMILKIENLHNDFNKTMFAIYNFPLKKLIVNAVFFYPCMAEVMCLLKRTT